MLLKKYYVFFIILIFTSLVAPAQTYNPDKVNKKAGAIYGRAYEAAEAGKYEESLKLLAEAQAIDPKFLDVYLSRAGIHAEMKNYEASIKDFEYGFKIDSVYASTYLLPYSISLAGTGQFEKALIMVNRFLATPKLNSQSIIAGKYRQSTYEFAIKKAVEMQDSGYVFAPKNMGKNINSAALEYFPSLTIDGKTLIYTRRQNNDEDFYESKFVDGQWTEAKPVSGNINTNLNEGAQNISQDGNWLIYTGCNYPEGQGSCDLYIAYKTKQGTWSEPANLGPMVNTEFWESSPSLSPDKKDLYFASSQPGGFGGKDIWVTHRLPSGKWSRPKNLGSSINTSGDEGCPFIHADNETLYFNSTGHEGYGLTDLFLAKKLSDENWSTPVNLGYPINTIDDEGSLIVSADGENAIYASDGADTYGGLDLYQFTLPKAVRAHKTLWVSGKVFDNNTKEGLPSSVVLTDINTRNIISSIQTDEDGNYLVTLPAGKTYGFTVNRKGYLFYSDNFVIEESDKEEATVINIPLKPLQAGATVILKNIFFDTNEAILKEESLTELDNLIALLKENKSLKILIKGYTDNVGQPQNNLTLSNKRAKAVVDYLIEKGIEKIRLTYKGFGETQPMAENNTEEGRAKNRRTELEIISN